MYTERLSEQLAVGDYATVPVTTSSGSTTATSAAIDGSTYNRLIAYGMYLIATATTTQTYTMSIKWQASIVSTFGGTPTTITTCTESVAGTTTVATVEDVLSCEVSGEQVQSSRALEDRYVRAIISGTCANKKISVTQLVLADAKRYHPS
jgi:hypothetical protein